MTFLFPENLEENKTYGVWVNNLNKKDMTGDVHIHLDSESIQIGQNVSYKDEVNFTDIGVGLWKDGKIIIQYEDEPKVAVHVEITEKEFNKEMLKLLKNLKKLAIKKRSKDEGVM